MVLPKKDHIHEAQLSQGPNQIRMTLSDITE